MKSKSLSKDHERSLNRENQVIFQPSVIDGKKPKTGFLGPRLQKKNLVSFSMILATSKVWKRRRYPREVNMGSSFGFWFYLVLDRKVYVVG